MAKNKKSRSTTSAPILKMAAAMDPAQPLYAQVRESLRTQILDGHFDAHERIPSESELTQSFGVSRITVRQALRDLQTAGLIFTVHGKGTFASKPKATQNVEKLQGFEEAMTALGYATSAQTIGVREVSPTSAVRAALKLGPTELVVEVKRVRYLDALPVSLDTSYFPLEIGRRLQGQDLTRDIFSLLENELGTPLGSADLKLEVGLSDSESQELLAMPPGEAVLRVERLTFDANDRPIDFEYLTYRGDRYQYQFRIKRK
jgi:GntR family transcriptional regulator